MSAPIPIRGPEDLLPFLDISIDPSRNMWLITMCVQHAIVQGAPSTLRQANAVPSEILLPAMLAKSICHLVKWGVERPHLSGKKGHFVVQRTFTQPTTSWFMDVRSRLLDGPFPDPALFKSLMEKMRREGVKFSVEVISKQVQ